MKKLLILLSAAHAVASTGFGADLETAKVTKVVNDVRLFRPATPVKKAAEGEVVSGNSSLQTGRRSRSELRFQDETLTRIGANSIFSFEEGSRDLRLEQGTMLLSVPKDAGGARIRTATVTAAVTGTTIMMEYDLKNWVKLIVLEGSLSTWVENGGKKSRKQTIKAGQMIFLKADATKMPKPVNVDLSKLLQTSFLASEETFGPLPGSAQAGIAAVLNKQSTLKKQARPLPEGGPIDSNPAERSVDNRDIANERPANVRPPVEIDPEGPPPGGGDPTEGDDP